MSRPGDQAAAGLTAAAALAGSDAVQLFEQRAQLVRPSFRVSDDNAAAVLQICRRLDGQPLAIELAAARMRILSAVQLAERLDDIFAVLTGGARSAPRRHQTLRATLDWSYDLLTAGERTVFRRLAVFAGGFTLGAAEQVAAGGDIPARDILDLLMRLADKSLLRVGEATGGARYHLLATIRNYARERLTEAAEEEPLRRAHLRYFTALAEETGPPLERGEGNPGLEEMLGQLDESWADIRAALDPPDELDGLETPDPGEAATAAPSAPAAPQAVVSPEAPDTPRNPEAPGSPKATLVIRALWTATVQLGDAAALTAADWGYAKPRELLFLLATSAPLTREQIGAALWPDASRQQLGNALHTALRELRRALGDPGWVVYANGRYALNPARPSDCDVKTFTAALSAARQARPATAALPDLQRAVAAYGGDFLADMAAGDWAHARREELGRAFESALLAMGRLQAAAGRYQGAATAFRRVIAHEPLNESAHRELMSCWERLGETARAVRHYEQFAGMLRDQVGVSPAAETTALYERLAGR